MERGMSRAQAKLKGMESGSKRDRILAQIRKYRRGLEQGKVYEPNNPEFARNTQDPDVGVRSRAAKLNLINRRLDEEISSAERRRLNRKRKKLVGNKGI